MKTTLKMGLLPPLCLMERVLRDGEPLADEYPLVFHAEGPGGVVSLDRENAVVSACSVLGRELVGPHGRLSVGLIGSVSTAPEFRGQGAATHILRQAEAEHRRQGHVLSMLWADTPSFYYARGYRPVGRERVFRVTPEVAPRLPEAPGIRAAAAGDAAAIHALYEAQPVRVDRTPVETASLLRCPGMEVRVLEREGQIVAYACRGRGRDLQNTVHEWTGSLEDVLALLRVHREETGADQPLCLSGPASRWDLRERLEALGLESRVGPLAAAKLLGRAAAARLLQEQLGPESSVRVEPTALGAPPRVELVGPHGRGELTDDVLLALLFGTEEVQPEIEALGQSFGLDLSRLPLDLYVWGLDSI